MQSKKHVQSSTPPNRKFQPAVLGLILVIGSFDFAAPLRASDGVIEINQVRAEVGGVTPEDTPGFPVTLSQPGSYRLTGNLDVRNTANPENTTAIQVTSNDVQIDLGGFAILGPVVCTPNGSQPTTLSCSPTGGTGIGVEGGGYGVPDGLTLNTRVLNGTVRGMGAGGVFAAHRVEKVIASSNGSVGIIAYSVASSEAHSNGVWGINAVHCTDCVAGTNGDEGIRASVVERAFSFGNTNIGVVGDIVRSSLSKDNQIGIRAFGVVSDTSVESNVGWGLEFPLSGGYRSCALTSNNSGGAQVSGGTEFGPNLCRGTTTCP
ncbi:MAG: hypothetical protein K8J08_06560 [Thermoanaerobaculia bacterium]|nr:hypothetical protein [Thermoanaerobaculia bacterium]